MIITFTANPSLDRTAQVEGVVTRGGVNRLGPATSEPGGKGVNVARAIHLAGQDVVAVLPADDGDPLLLGLDSLGVAYRNVPIGSPARSNLTLVEADGTTSKFNEPGPALGEELLVTLRNTVVGAARTANGGVATWAVLSGSLPPGTPTNAYVHLVNQLHELGVKVAVDTSDAPLQALAAALPTTAPDLVKPNSEELGQLCDTDGLALEAEAAKGNWAPVLEAAHRLTAQGIGQVLVTLGGSGALLVTADGAWHATPPRIDVASTVGAGDSSLAGYLLADVEGLDAPERLRRAVAYGSGAAALPGSQLPSPEQTLPEQVTVTPVG
ncbi:MULTISPECIES: 1-phosphofructokinase family hexose kinase [unclassified Luteococcus]|uniref:1-phosphofructokinase family hexose kinase n=1 Tax=unclassified Luteococcus TaxID=2639923 RepID=UPI00313D8CD0